MDKKKYIKPTEEEIMKYAEMLKNIKGHYMAFLISTSEEGEKDWKAEGHMSIGSTMDGERWGELEMGVKSSDVNSDSALATVMVALNNYINSPEFVVEMGKQMEDALGKDPKLPEIFGEPEEQKE